MNLSKSFKAFGEICREDADFRRLGRPPGWSVWYHYRGRWHDRRSRPTPPGRVCFRDGDRRLEFEMSDKYVGAFKGVFVDREYDCAALVQPAPQRILDLGANIGFGAVFFAGLFPHADIITVEPDPRNLPLLKSNLRLNGVRAHLVEAAAGSTSGTLGLRIGDNPTCSSLTGTGMHALSGTVTVQVMTVPEIMQHAGWPRIDLLKIDIEGAEDDLLTVDNGWLGKVGAILVEVHPNTTADRLNAALAPYGFELRRLGTGREPVYFARKETVR